MALEFVVSDVRNIDELLTEFVSMQTDKMNGTQLDAHRYFRPKLAETAFVLLFGVFAALLTSETQHTRAMSLQKSRVAELTQNLDSAKAGNVALKARMDALLPKLRSTTFPTCVAVGKAKDWLFTATVRGRDAYEIEGQLVSLANITKLYSVQLRDADENECRQKGSDYMSGRECQARNTSMQCAE